MTNQKQKRRAGTILKCAALGAVLISVAGCVVDPYPPPPPVAVAPAPAYYAGPYSYYDYPPYYPGYAYGGPSVGLAFGGGGYGYHRWR